MPELPEVEFAARCLRRWARGQLASGEVLVEKRPPSGIWGGLWSLPEAPPGADPAAWVRKHWGLRVDGAEALEPFSHAFTHFTLEAVPWLVRARGDPEATGESRAAWLPLQEASAAALPAPVKKLLAALRDAPSGRGPARRGSDRGSKGVRRGR